MPIKVGDKIPDTKFRVMTAEGPQARSTDDIFKGRKVALFAVPGAFTGTCSTKHLPSVITSFDALRAKGIDTIAMTAVNDIAVMDAWQKAQAAQKVVFLADGSADFAKAVGLTVDLTQAGMGTRSQRYSMIVDDGVVTQLNIDEAPGKYEVSGGDHMLAKL